MLINNTTSNKNQFILFGDVFHNTQIIINVAIIVLFRRALCVLAFYLYPCT